MSDDLLEQFIIEGRELVQAASQGLLALEREPTSSEVLNDVFRAMHTLKGSAALFDLAELGRVMHAAESRLENVRRGGAQIDEPLIGALLRAVGTVTAWLDALEDDGRPSDGLRADAARMAASLDADVAATEEAPVVPGLAEAAWFQPLREQAGELGARTAFRYAPAADAYFRGDDPVALMAGVPDLAWMTVEPTADLQGGADYAPFECRLVFLGLSRAPVEAVRELFRLAPDEVELVPVAPTASPVARLRTLRVAADQVDAVAALVDELVIAKNALSHLLGAEVGSRAGREMLVKQAALDRVVAGLHGAVSVLRMAPLAPVIDRLPLQVRELAQALGKDVRLEVSGGDLAVDKSIVDGLFEPLLHLVRNAIDHGIETPAGRAAAGKPARSVLRLRALAAGDEAVIELIDDGRGVDPEAVRRTAAARGLLTEVAAASLSDASAIDLLFAPGFSTARRVTEVSGRGVGLDAVREVIGRLGGRVTLESTVGRGTTARIAVPLRAVLTKVAVACVGGERFGVPVSDIREVVRVRADEVTPIRSGRAFVHREQVVPLLHLADLLGLASTPAAIETAVLVGDGTDQVAVAVETLGEQVEAPLRPMSGLLAGLPGVQGSIVEGDGRVLMVIDLPELVG